MPRAGFTLVELLVVITIIGLVSVLAIPTVIHSVGERHLIGSVQGLQGALIQARDLAASSGRPRWSARGTIRESPCGIRLRPSVTNPTKLDTILPLITPEPYRDGTITTSPAPAGPGPLTITGNLTAWAWNIRLGDRLILSPHAYTVCGPMVQRNADLFVNYPTGQTVESLDLVNGRDDDHDGYPDNGWDGMDNNGDGTKDDPAEWEQETWLGPAVVNGAYSIVRGPAPGRPELVLGLRVPIDVASSTLIPNPIFGNVDIVIRPTGEVVPAIPYGVPSYIGLGQARQVFVFDDGSDQRKLTLWTRTGRVEVD